MPKNDKVWIVVADGARARLLEAAGDGRGLLQVPGGVLEGSRALAGDIMADRPGRSYESVGGQRHAIEPRVSVRDQIEDEFVDEVIERLEQERAAGQFDQLVVVAAPRALGAFRKRAPAALTATVVATLDRDLTRAPLVDVEAAVRPFAPV